MIDLYYWTTPNGHKITIFLEEAGLPYKIIPVNIGKGEQFKPEFLAISPNNRIPAIVDHEPAGGGAPIAVFESGAILLYLAEKTGQFLPHDLRGRTEVMQWLFWQMGSLGPMAGQNHHFSNYAPRRFPTRSSATSTRSTGSTACSTGGSPTATSSPATIRSPTWRAIPGSCRYERQHQNIDDFPHLKRWFEAIKARPAVERAYAKAKEVNPNPGGIRTAEERAILFGQTAAVGASGSAVTARGWRLTFVVATICQQQPTRYEH